MMGHLTLNVISSNFSGEAVEIRKQALAARSDGRATLFGSADQALGKIESSREMGIRSFIFSGHPHIDEARYFGKLVMPDLKTCFLPHAYDRVPTDTPATPFGNGSRT